MATGGAPSNYRDYNGYPKTMYTSRTRSMLPSSAPKSNSAMSSRTYSRIKGNTPTKAGSSPEVRRSMNFEANESSQFDDSLVDIEELQNEKELLKRMIEQQKQLQELRDRQKRVLQLQQQLAGMETNAEYSMEDKLDKLQTAKTRLDDLQKLVSTIKSVENGDKEGSGDSSARQTSDKTQQVRKALEELNQLKALIGMVSASANTPANQQKPVVTMEPVFANSVEADEQSEMTTNYQPVLPEVSVVQYDDAWEDSPGSTRRPSSHSTRKRSPKKSGRITKSPANPSPYQSRRSSSAKKKGKVVRTVSPKKEEKDSQSSERLLEEMKRHQVLLKELRERRQELEDLMNMTRGTEVDEEENGEEEEGGREEDYNDTNASIRSNLGSPDESRGVSDEEANNFETSQSGQLFGLNEIDTRRLIDLIRNQKNLGAATEKTTATWGSSSSATADSTDSDDMEDRPQFPDNDDSRLQLSTDKRFSKVSVESQIGSAVGTSVKDAFTQLNYKEEHEIDFRPPTRRRRNITQTTRQGQVLSLDPGSYPSTVSKLQEDLIASNNTMHILLEDQLSLTKLLLNTLNLQQTMVSNNLCYGISPDFLIYQLDNCSAQFAATLKETKDLQWQVYGLTKGTEKAANATRTPLATLSLPAQQNTIYQNQSEIGNSQETSVPKLPFSVETVDDFQQSGGDDRYELARKDEASGDAGNDLFEALRDSIYSEAAILISQNESRPHFLVELFTTLQQLNTDYLRQHALYTLQDVMKGYLPASPRKSGGEGGKESPPRNGAKGRNSKIGSFSENTPSESAATSEDEVYTKLKAKDTAGYDFSLKISSASELSTPSEDDTENNPFAAEDLGSTVIHLDAALRHMREMERIKQEMQNAANSGQGATSSTVQEKADVAQVNTKILRVWIKNIISEIIPILKNNHDKVIDKKLVKLMQGKVLECVGKGMENEQLSNGVAGGDTASETADDTDKLSIADFFSGQLKSILDDSLTKFIGKRVGSCGEDLIVGLSEILFNELAFFYMMQDLSKEKQAVEKKTNIPVIKIDDDEAAPAEKEDSTESNSQENDDKEGPQNEEDSEVSNVEDNIPESIAENQDENFKDSEKVSPDPVTVDLSASETRPLTSYGSGEDEEDGSGDEFEYREQDVPTSMQQDANGEQESEKQDEQKKEETEVEQPTSQDGADEKE